MDAVERTSLVINDRLKSPLICEFKDGHILVSCTTPLGSASDPGSPLICRAMERKWALTADSCWTP